MSSVQVENHGPVRVVAINRPDKLNALDEPCRRELLASLTEAARDDAVRVVVLTGIGRAFCTGQDLGVGTELEDAGATVRDTYNPLARILREMDKPTIAAVDGPAVGAGLGLALCCDLRYMASSAYLACSFSRVALVPDTGTTVALVRQLGHARAFEVAVTGRRIGAEEAAEAHLINGAVADDGLLDAVLKTAGTLAAGPARAYALTKRLMVSAANSPEFEVLEEEAAFQGLAAHAEDHQKAIAAFLDSRSKR
jgi:2-(1,2-epoxy-1,2-dihydrophenyl)acetyl-CoA isomerase